MNDILLTADEMLAFNARLAVFTDDRLTVGPRAITRGEARALWSTMKAFHSGKSLATKLPRMPQRRSRQVHRVGTAFVLVAAAALAGCTTLGGNVKGSFACRAPDGMCAPTSKIDDQALAMISGGDADAIPATVINPYDRADPRLMPTTASAAPTRSSEKVLRIVFPAHVDRLGRYREASAIHAVVERGTWMTSAQARNMSELAPSAPREDQMAMIANAPSLAELASSSPEADFPQLPVETTAVAYSAPVAAKVDVNAPDPALVAAARRKGHAVNARAASVRTSLASARPLNSSFGGRGVQALAQPVAAVTVHSGIPTLPRKMAALQAAETSANPARALPLGAPVPASAAAYDLRGAGTASPLQAIRDQVGSILTAKATVRTASAAPKAESLERPVNGPSILSVSGVEK